MVEYNWDAFICHASEDKPDFVLPLADGLRKEGFRIWLDIWCLEIGSRLSESIEDGLLRSRYGIVVLSNAFFVKKWPKRELAALLSMDSPVARKILPVWYHLSIDEVRANAPLLSDVVAANFDEETLSQIVNRLARILSLSINSKDSGNEEITWESIVTLTKKLYPSMRIDPFWQTQLLANLDSAVFHSTSDIERAVRRARVAVQAYAEEQPHLFKSGTDYITKSLGFVDLCFRSRHSWSSVTRKAFVRHANKIDWDM